MRRGELLYASLVAAVIVAMGDATAHADLITLQVSGTLSPFPPPPNQPPSDSCASTGCILGGEIVFNNATGAVISANVTATGFSPGAGPFTAPQPLHTTMGLTDLEITTDPTFTSEAALIFSTPTEGSLVGYTGGSLSTGTNVRPQSGAFGWGLISGSLTQIAATPVPEPCTWAMSLTGFAGLGWLAHLRRRKLKPV
jgi:hypothetical protein